MNYKNDLVLSKINIEDYEMFSLDIFDTLLFRMCARPEDIFTKVGELAIDKFGDAFGYSSKTFREVRKLSEQKARKVYLNKNEINYDNIYEFMPFDGEIREYLKKIELEVEKENIFLNESVYSFIRECYSKGRKIILVSDMYLFREQIEDILKHTNLDLEMIHNIYVSSENNETKHNGNLFKLVLEDYSYVPSNRILHIGDNYYADFLQARENKMHAVYYPPIIEDYLSIYQLEEKISDECANNIRSLRKIVSHTAKYSGDDLALYKIGSEVYGPFYSAFAEWVVEQAIQKDIKKVLPLMREGMLLSTLIKKIVDDRKLDIVVTPTYISRKASYLPSIKELTEKHIDEVLKRENLILYDVFNLFLLPIENTEFEHYKYNTLGECHLIRSEEQSITQRLKNYFLQDEQFSSIKENIQKQKQYLKQYITEISGNESFITVDLGGNGTIQSNIDILFPNKAIHLFVYGTEKALEKIINGQKIFSWMGFENDFSKLNEIFARHTEVLEAITSIMEPGTDYYKRNEFGIVEPVKSLTNYSYDCFLKQEIIWNGIADFQQYFLKLSHKKIKLTSNELFNIVERFISYPTFKEVKSLQNFFFEDHVTYTSSRKLIEPYEKGKINNKDYYNFLSHQKKPKHEERILWPEGIVTLDNPLYFLDIIYGEDSKIFKHIVAIIKGINLKCYRSIAIYGAGEIGIQVYNILKYLDIKVTLFVDKNYKNIIREIPVCDMSGIPEDIDLIIIASVVYKEEIFNELSCYYKENANKPNILKLL
ncbi:predicted HAD superfamily hydrolase [Ureibacillus xyleni]|uniref:Predicted HAD superfamily hydrolase n=1 Tax=Ureibacillus xyleni TaxID=614648 RepID=A0A285RBN1_9BACL|nr:HAD hydrolase-like protein [Ureibacillus xyleni]SOB91168.1 predicted HAD superfamily hydrolase [Ureibacillus xyleni]